MNAVIDETVRLYSRQSPLPVDVVAPEHQAIHADLERWGSWNREKYRPATAASAEGDYHRTRAQDQSTDYPQLSIANPPNPRNAQIDRAILKLPKDYQAALRLFYVSRSDSTYICRVLHLHWCDFGERMSKCREMVLNILRIEGA